MKYATLKLNDIANAPGISVSLFVQGCPHHCRGCFNPDTWSFEGGKEFTTEILNQILENLHANNIDRNFCVLGGEPLCAENTFLTYMVIKEVKEKSPNTKIYVWTGYTFEELLAHPPHTKTKSILQMVDVLIDGPYIEELRDITLPMRGSSNQRIIDLSKKF